MSSKIIRLRAENIKRLRAIDITPPSDPLIKIGGANGAGKSSTLDSIAMAFGGGNEIPEVPVRAGEEKASVIIDLGDLIVKRTFTRKGGTSLTVENKEGARYPSPQAVLDKLTGKLTFDPVAFNKLDSKAQLEALQKLLNLDLTDLDAQRKKLYDERTAANKDTETAEAKLSFMDTYPEAPAEEPDPAEAMKELEAALNHNAKQAELGKATQAATVSRDNLLTGRKDIIEKLEAARRQVAYFEERLSKADEGLPLLEAKVKEANEAAAAFQPIDVLVIRQRIDGLKSVSLKVRANKAAAEAADAVLQKRARAGALTDKIAELDDQREKMLAAAKFPVPGMGFNEHGVTFNGLPFAQASSAEQLRVSVAMAAALNPKLKVMLIRDGSLMDDSSLELLAELARLHDLQVWVEMVGRDETCSVIIEDGAVKPVETEAATTA